MENFYFDRPKQVVFSDPDNQGEWIVGIAYKDEIICACCGGIFSIDDVVEMAKEDGRKCAIYPYEDWIDIAYEITGDEMPQGLAVTEHRIVEVDFANCETEEEQEVEFDGDAEEYDAWYFTNLE